MAITNDRAATWVGPSTPQFVNPFDLGAFASVNQQAAIQPVLVVQTELSQPIPDIRAGGTDYSATLTLVRLHGHPLGYVKIDFDGPEIDAATHTEQIWQKLHRQINAHLVSDGLESIAGLDASGLPDVGAPDCHQLRDDALIDAPFVTVVVSTRDRTPYVQPCIDTLLAMGYPHFEILIVDNAPSTDATRDLIMTTYANEPKVRYILEPLGGLACARNRGAAEAQGEIIAFMDDDALAEPTWLSEIVASFSLSDRVQCVTGLVAPAELETGTQIILEQFAGYGKGFIRQLFDLDEHPIEEAVFPFCAGRFGTGANMAVRASALWQVGGFNVALGAGTPTGGGEELDLFFRLIVSGSTIVYEPAAIVWHVHSRNAAYLPKMVYNFGVGFTAYLVSILLDQPRWLLPLLLRLPAGALYFLSPFSRKNANKTKVVPSWFRLLEFKGMVVGPLRCLQSRWKYRHVQARAPYAATSPSRQAAARDYR